MGQVFSGNFKVTRRNAFIEEKNEKLKNIYSLSYNYKRD